MYTYIYMYMCVNMSRSDRLSLISALKHLYKWLLRGLTRDSPRIYDIYIERERGRERGRGLTTWARFERQSIPERVYQLDWRGAPPVFMIYIYIHIYTFTEALPLESDLSEESLQVMIKWIDAELPPYLCPCTTWACVYYVRMYNFLIFHVVHKILRDIMYKHFDWWSRVLTRYSIRMHER